MVGNIIEEHFVSKAVEPTPETPNDHQKEPMDWVKKRGPVTWVIRSLALSRDNKIWNRAQDRQRREMGEGVVQA